MTQPSASIDFARVGITGLRLEALFEAVPLAIAVFDGDLRLVNGNARYRELTDVANSLTTRISIYDAFPNALADLTDQIDSALRGSPMTTAVRIPFQHRGGRRLIETTFATLIDESGGRGILFAGNDVSEREELRETLSRNVAQLESIFDVIPDSVRVFDSEGRTVRSNTQALQD
ncbi:MAG TPA: PAS domain-containing protein, partial [Gemmatimonadaceae bacterium]|nr:PAS domain-containing protein [Gemmatimonadaceae bacterium]